MLSSLDLDKGRNILQEYSLHLANAALEINSEVLIELIFVCLESPMRTMLELGGRISTLGFSNRMNIPNMTKITISPKFRLHVRMLESSLGGSMAP